MPVKEAYTAAAAALDEEHPGASVEAQQSCVLCTFESYIWAMCDVMRMYMRMLVADRPQIKHAKSFQTMRMMSMSMASHGSSESAL